MSREADLAQFCARLGHEFADPALLEEALTHRSFFAEGARNNQRLEFLGDRVLGLVTASALLDLDTQAEEGDLAPRLNAMVRKETCAEVAAEIGLGTVMRIGRSEMLSGGRRKTAMLGDGMEAVIAAVYIDAGFEAASAMIQRLWGARFEQAEGHARDPKTSLQEWAQARGFKPPEYKVVGRQGPDHAPIFEIEAALENGQSARARDRSKRAAQQNAAAKLLDALEHTS